MLIADNAALHAKLNAATPADNAGKATHALRLFSLLTWAQDGTQPVAVGGRVVAAAKRRPAVVGVAYPTAAPIHTRGAWFGA